MYKPYKTCSIKTAVRYLWKWTLKANKYNTEVERCADRELPMDLLHMLADNINTLSKKKLAKTYAASDYMLETFTRCAGRYYEAYELRCLFFKRLQEELITEVQDIVSCFQDKYVKLHVPTMVFTNSVISSKNTVKICDFYDRSSE